MYVILVQEVTHQIRETLIAWAQTGALLLIEAIIVSALLSSRP